MSAAPRIGVPPLAGLCTLEEAARIGYSVDESVAHLLRYHWIEKRLSEVCAARIPTTPEWEVKGAFSLHQWLDIEHADMFRRRIREMRQPMPRIDVAPDTVAEQVLQAVETAGGTTDLLRALIGTRTWLLKAYRDHYHRANPVVDHPTRRLLRFIMLEEKETLSWTRQALQGLTESSGADPGPSEHPFEPRRDGRFDESYNFNF